MRKIFALQGWPGSGKSTFAAKWLAEDPESRSRVSRDDLRAQLFNSEGILSPDQESVVTKVLNAQIIVLLKSDKDILIDATNLNAKFLRQLSDFCKKNGATSFETIRVETDVDECVRRDAARFAAGGRGVGEEAIRGLAKRFPVKNWPNVNWVAGDDIATKQYTGTPGKPKAFLLDLDGTIAHMNGKRSPFDTSRYHLDDVSEVIRDIVNALRNQGYACVVSSGRDAAFKNVSFKWLTEKANVIPDRMVMRREGDVRNDAIIKEELFWEEIAPNYDVHFVLDDRDRVVEKWRAMGLVCLQVAEGAF
jgi:predicted kinase